MLVAESRSIWAEPELIGERANEQSLSKAKGLQHIANDVIDSLGGSRIRPSCYFVSKAMMTTTTRTMAESRPRADSDDIGYRRLCYVNTCYARAASGRRRPAVAPPVRGRSRTKLGRPPGRSDTRPTSGRLRKRRPLCPDPSIAMAAFVTRAPTLAPWTQPKLGRSRST